MLSLYRIVAQWRIIDHRFVKEMLSSLHVSTGDAQQDMLAFFHVLERLKVCTLLRDLAR